MSATLRLLPLLLRRSPRQSAGAITLCAAGVAVAALVGGTVLGAYLGFSRREPRVVWRDPAPAVADRAAPTALQRHGVDWFDGRQIDRVDLAALGSPEAVPVPPGLRDAPRPGTAWVSPALAALIRSHPADELGDRFGTVVGEIGRAGLAHPDELVAVVGTTPDRLGTVVEDPSPAGGVAPGELGVTVPIERFDRTRTDADLQLYRNLALVAVVLLVVPALVLIGSAARLTAARREHRMAALRLAGATPGAVRLLSVAETAIGASIGAVVGIASSIALAPVLARVPMGGGAWFTADLRLPLPAAALAVLGCVGVCAVATAVSLRRVASRPLGVARSTDPRPSRWPRLLGLVAAIALLGLTTVASAAGTFANRDGQPPDLTVPMVAALGTVIASLALVGPWVTSLVGRGMVGAARRSPLLVAGRRILDDPNAAYRTVSAVVLAGLLAGFLSGVLPTVRALTSADVPAGTATVTLDRAAADALVADVTAAGGSAVHDGGRQLHPDDPVDVTVAATGGELERIRTATAGVRGGEPLVASGDDRYGDVGFTEDVVRASIAVLVAGLVLAFGASAVASAAAVVDQRRVIGRMVLCGTDVGTLQRARRLEAVLPLTVATTGSVGIGLACSVLLMRGFGAPAGRIVGPDVGTLAAIVVGAAVVGLLSAELSRPLLGAAARATAGVAPRP